MSSPQRSGATATATPTRRRRPVWAWLLLALLAIAIVIAILFLTGRCGSGSTTGAPPAPPAGAAAPAAPGAPPAGAAPGAPGAPPAGAAPGGDGGNAPGSAPGTAPGATGGGTGGDGSTAAPGAPGDPAALQSRIDQIVAATPITFRANSAELTDAGAESLGRVAEELAAVPAARVQVTGYSAPLGGATTPDPQQLSDQRATTVADQLAGDGVDRARVQTRGASDTEPRPDPAASRRAEITVS
ncbi:OmpA family protein [Actinomycetospora rhizophila]|uniref:OmpA family protein n=1 Tax=Actinomycetospora rhizophila TaxID=1416876 RepID=A0ABV9ZI28_9PSEU